MKVILIPAKFDYRSLAGICIDAASVGSLIAALTTEGIYIVHLDRLTLETAEGTRAIIGQLAARGMTAAAIGRQLGIAQKTAERYHPAAYASQSRKERPDHAGGDAVPSGEAEPRSVHQAVGEDLRDPGAHPKGKSQARRGLGAARRRRAGRVDTFG